MVALEQKDQVQAPPETPATTNAAPENSPKQNIDTSKATTGEKYYGILKFAAAETIIVGVTAITAYWALYSKRTALNVFGHAQDFAKKLFSPLKNLGEEGTKLRKNGTILYAMALGTTATFHGGNAFAPIMKWFDNKKNDIVDYFNEKYGEPGELEIGRERLKDDPKQSWGDVIKGRLLAWATVFTAFASAVFLLPNSKQNGKSHLGNIEEKCGRWLASFSKDKEAFEKVPFEKVARLADHTSGSHPHPLSTNTAYRFGKILALDIYATAAAIAIWNTVSELSARKRHKEQKSLRENCNTVDESQTAASHSFASSVKPRTSHSDAIGIERDALNSQPLQLGA